MCETGHCLQTCCPWNQHVYQWRIARLTSIPRKTLYVTAHAHKLAAVLDSNVASVHIQFPVSISHKSGLSRKCKFVERGTVHNHIDPTSIKKHSSGTYFYACLFVCFCFFRILLKFWGGSGSDITVLPLIRNGNDV